MADSAQPGASAPGEAPNTGDVARQVAAFLRGAVHDEVDGARVGPVRILTSADGSRVYAGAVVSGPLRVYVATAWGPAGAASRKTIVSYPDMAGARAALDTTLARQEDKGYTTAGEVDGEE